jgi:colicin import membrane protein
VETNVQRLMPWVYSLLLHAVFVALLVLSIHWSNSMLPSLGGHGDTAQPVQATVVDQKLIQQQMDVLQAQEKQKQQAAQQLQQQAAAAKTEREQEEQKVTQLKQQQAAAQQALDQKLADLQKQAQAEKAQQDRIAKLKAEATAAAKKKQNAQHRAELQREIAVEQGALNARRASLLSQWIAIVKQKVQNNWNEPANTPDDLSCKVQVEQVPGGTITSAQIVSCNGDEAVKQSVVTAVLRSSPLPPPSEPSLFQRVFVLNFTPQNNQGN